MSFIPVLFNFQEVGLEFLSHSYIYILKEKV